MFKNGKEDAALFSMCENFAILFVEVFFVVGVQSYVYLYSSLSFLLEFSHSEQSSIFVSVSKNKRRSESIPEFIYSFFVRHEKFTLARHAIPSKSEFSAFFVIYPIDLKRPISHRYFFLSIHENITLSCSLLFHYFTWRSYITLSRRFSTLKTQHAESLHFVEIVMNVISSCQKLN